MEQFNFKYDFQKASIKDEEIAVAEAIVIAVSTCLQQGIKETCGGKLKIDFNKKQFSLLCTQDLVKELQKQNIHLVL